MRAILFLLAACSLSAQETALNRLKREALAARNLDRDSDKNPTPMLHRALRDWIESRLPANKGLLGVERYLDSKLEAELKQAGLEVADINPDADSFDAFGFGYVGVELKRLPELPDTLVVTAGVSIPCGVDEAVNVYHFDTEGRRRLFEEQSENGYGSTDIELSPPDPQGRRLLLIHRTSQQCASTWMGMTYSVYRLPYISGTADRMLSLQHGFWLNDGPEFVLKPDELIVEYLDGSVDMGVHNRTHIERYSFAQGARRLDPVAFQPQDFVEEWLTRPWGEMQSRSKTETKEWHLRLHGEFVLGDYMDFMPCVELPGRWLIGLDITNIGTGGPLKESIKAYFVVRDLGNYRYQMESVSDSRPAQCSSFGTQIGLDKHPWLSPVELRALRPQ